MIGALGLTIFASSVSGNTSGSSKTTASLPSFKPSNLVPGLTAFTTASALEANLGSHAGGAPVLSTALSAITVTGGTATVLTTGLLGTGSLTWTKGSVGSYLWAEGTFGATIAPSTPAPTDPPSTKALSLLPPATKIASASKAGLAAGFTAKKAGLFNSCLVVDFASSKVEALTTPSQNFKAAIVPMGSGWKATSNVPATPRRYVAFNSQQMYHQRATGATASDLSVTPFAAPVAMASTIFAHCGWTYLNAGEKLAFAVQPATGVAVNIAVLTGSKTTSVDKSIFTFYAGIGGMYDPSWNYSNIHRNLSKPFVAVPVKSNAKFDLNNIHDWAYEGKTVNTSVCDIVSNNTAGQVTRDSETACLVISNGAFLGDLVAAGINFSQTTDLIAVIVPGRAMSDEVGYGRYAGDAGTGSEIQTQMWLNGYSQVAIPAIGQTEARQNGLTSGGLVLSVGLPMPIGTKSVVIAYVAKGNKSEVVMNRPRKANAPLAEAGVFLLQGLALGGTKVKTTTTAADKIPCVLYKTTTTGTSLASSPNYEPMGELPYTDTYYLPIDSYSSANTSFTTPTTVANSSSGGTTALNYSACLIGAQGVGRKAGKVTFKLTINTSGGIATGDDTELNVTAMRYLVTEAEADLTQADSIYYGRDVTTAQKILQIANATASKNVSHQTIKTGTAGPFTFTVPVGMGASKGFHDIAALQIACVKGAPTTMACTSIDLSLETSFVPYETLDAGLSTTNDTTVGMVFKVDEKSTDVGILPVHLTSKTQAAAFTNNTNASIKTGILTLPKGVTVNIPLQTGQPIAFMPTAAPTAGYSSLDNNPFGTYGAMEKGGNPPIRYIVPYLAATVTKNVTFEVSALDMKTLKFNSNFTATQEIGASANKTNTAYALKKQPILAYDRYDSAGANSTAMGDTAVLTLRMTANDTADITDMGVGYAVAGASGGSSASARVIVVVAAFVSALVAMLVA